MCLSLFSSVRDSGSIEQDADIVMLLYREEYYNEDTDRQDIADVFIRKNRDGETGDVELLWKPKTMTFGERTAPIPS